MKQFCKNLGIFVLLSFFLLMIGCNSQDEEEDLEAICDDDQTLVDGECIDDEVSDTTTPVILGVQNWIYIKNEERPIYLEVVSANENLDTDGRPTNRVSMDLSYIDDTVDGIYDIYYTVEDAAGYSTTETTTAVTVLNTMYAEANGFIYPYLTWWKVYGSSMSVESSCIIGNCYVDLQITRKCILLNISD